MIEENKDVIYSLPPILENIEEEKENKFLWRSCCGVVSDKRILTFVASLSISLIIIMFSCFQLTNGLNCSQENVYVGLLTLIVGFWMKSPIGE
jgi:hypothetical protein